MKNLDNAAGLIEAACTIQENYGIGEHLPRDPEVKALFLETLRIAIAELTCIHSSLTPQPTIRP